jgi:hypothetical protein
MKPMPMTTAFNVFFGLNIIGLAIFMATVVIWPNVDFSDVGVTGKSFWGYLMGAFFSCPWLPPRKKGVERPEVKGAELYIRLGGVMAGLIQSFL